MWSSRPVPPLAPFIWIESVRVTSSTLAVEEDEATGDGAVFAVGAFGCADTKLPCVPGQSDDGVRRWRPTDAGPPPDGLRIRPAARAVVMDTNRRVLLVHFDFGPDDLPTGLWACPGGGVDPGESLEAALVRELREEVGLDVA